MHPYLPRIIPPTLLHASFLHQLDDPGEEGVPKKLLVGLCSSEELAVAEWLPKAPLPFGRGGFAS